MIARSYHEYADWTFALAVIAGVVILYAWGSMVRSDRFSMRFSLPSLFVVMTIVAVLGGGFLWFRNQYYWQLHMVNAVLAEHPEIEKVWMSTNDDTTLEVEQVYFSVADRPELTFKIDLGDEPGASETRERLKRALQDKQPVPRPVQFPEISQ